MKHIEGYVCTVRLDFPPGLEHIELFGKISPQKIGKIGFRWSENIVGNNLTPYGSFEEAVLALDELQEANRSSFLERGLAKLAIDIPENEEEVKLLADKGPYVVVIHGDLGLELQGAATEEAYPSTIPGAALVLNGLKPITSFESAKYIKSEAARQAWAKTEIIRWQFSRLGEYVQPRLL